MSGRQQRQKFRDALSAASFMLLGEDLPRWEIRPPAPGLRHNTKERIVPHRFPIKDGLTGAEVGERLILSGNALLSRLHNGRS